MTPTCELHGCTDELPLCHRCGKTDGVKEVFIVDVPYPMLAGTTPKVVGHWSHACPPCIEEYEDAFIC